MDCSVLTADGRQEIARLSDGSCCPVKICDLDTCGIICNFIRLLPNGPLWDKAKAVWLEQYGGNCDANGIDTGLPCAPSADCLSIVQHSIYTAKLLTQAIFGPLLESVNESSPQTAFKTMDDWLLRLGWVDCYNSACRSSDVGTLTPFEIEGVCGPIFCGDLSSKELSESVKHGIILSLLRLQMNPIKNLDGINFVIKPLGAYLEDNQICPPDGNLNPCCDYNFKIYSKDGTIDLWSEGLAACNGSCPPTVDDCGIVTCCTNAFYMPDSCSPSGLPAVVYPGVLAAECIVRSMLSHCPALIKIQRTC